jgi:predicted MFS family arabinose efflux permease
MVLAFLVQVDARMMTPLLPTIAHSLGTSVTAMGLSMTLYGLALVMLGLGYIALHTTLQTRATELAPAARGTAVALFAFALFLGGALGALAFGPLVDHGWHRLFLATCGVSLLGLGAVAVRLLGHAPDAA